MNMILTGFMGTGKSAVGKILAGKLGYVFLDTDSLIEESTGISISSIFEECGEEGFRQMEAEAIEAASERDKLVIACGGGVILNAKNIENLSRNGIIVNLYASAGTIYNRIKSEKHRPLLECAEPLKEIAKLLEKRKNFYAVNDFSFDTDELSASEVAEKILNHKDITAILKKGEN